MVINGRKYLGQAPTMIAGPNTLMRFGVVGMGSDTHTFHIHGHRWIIPGADGTTDGSGAAGNVQDNPQIKAVSQFEDTRVFGPANSFVFNIQEGGTSFMGAQPPFGEWHMHCHVLEHMMDGMMGSLLVVADQQAVTPLPQGVPLPMPGMDGPGGGSVVSIGDNVFQPANVPISAGATVTWTNNGGPHTVTSNGHMGANVMCMPMSSEDFDSGGPIASGASFQHTFANPGSYPYHCDIHGCSMSGNVTVT
jgi:plastocyanin